jgi:hypothetical protein
MTQNSATSGSGPRWPVILVLAIGSLQLIGFLIRLDFIRDLGRMTAASPLPLVFSDFRGLETFSLDFTITGETRDGLTIEKRVTPELYGEFQGPYNRRNVYGAVLSYGPRLTKDSERPLVEAVLKYAFCDRGPLAAMFTLDGGRLNRVLIHARSKARDGGGPYLTEVACP